MDLCVFFVFFGDCARARAGQRGVFFSSLAPAPTPTSRPLPLRTPNPQKRTRAVSKGDRVAQLVLERIATPEVVEDADLGDTARGAGGFGSTGVAGALPPAP